MGSCCNGLGREDRLKLSQGPCVVVCNIWRQVGRNFRQEHISWLLKENYTCCHHLKVKVLLHTCLKKITDRIPCIPLHLFGRATRCPFCKRNLAVTMFWLDNELRGLLSTSGWRCKKINPEDDMEPPDFLVVEVIPAGFTTVSSTHGLFLLPTGPVTKSSVADVSIFSYEKPRKNHWIPSQLTESRQTLQLGLHQQNPWGRHNLRPSEGDHLHCAIDPSTSWHERFDLRRTSSQSAVNQQSISSQSAVNQSNKGCHRCQNSSSFTTEIYSKQKHHWSVCANHDEIPDFMSTYSAQLSF